MRRLCVAVWVGLTLYGLYSMLGLTGLGLACPYVTPALRRSRRSNLITLTLPSERQITEGRVIGPSQKPAKPAAKPLVGVALNCWICPWCVGVAQLEGDMGWMFKDEVSAAVYAAVRRRVLQGGL